MKEAYNKYTAAPVISLADVTVISFDIPLPLPDPAKMMYGVGIEVVSLPSGISVVLVRPELAFEPLTSIGTFVILVEYHVRLPWDSLSEADQAALVTAAYAIQGHHLCQLLAPTTEAPHSPYIPLLEELREDLADAVRRTEDWTGRFSYLEKLTLHEIDYM